MKKILILLCVLALFLFVTACAKKQNLSIAPTDLEPQTPSQPVVNEEVPESPEQVVIVQTIPDSLKNLLAKRWLVKSITYDLKSSELPFQRTFKIKGSRMVVSPASSETLQYENSFFTTIFIDTKQKTANAYCDIHRLCRSVEKGPFVVPFDLYYSKTPYDWAQELEDGKYQDLEEEPGEVLIEGRPTTSYRITEDGLTTEFYVEKFYGFPLKIESLDASGNRKNWVYDSPAFNTVTEEQVTPKV